MHQQRHYREYSDLGWCEHGLHVSPVQFSSRWHLGAQESPCRRIPPHLLEDSPVVPLKQFQCWFDWRQPFRIILTPSMSSWERVDVYVCACLSWREWERESWCACLSMPASGSMWAFCDFCALFIWLVGVGLKTRCTDTGFAKVSRSGWGCYMYSRTVIHVHALSLGILHRCFCEKK